jgi:DNA polymerase-3 subunit delta'
MLFKDIIAQDHIKKHLIYSANEGRVPHAQLFCGPEGSGTLAMALAYAQLVMCQNPGGENDAETACNLKFDKFNHPDIHFIFPTVTTDKIKTKPKSADFLSQWVDLLKENKYPSLMDWYSALGVDNKQGEIRVDDAQDVLKQMSLKSYEGGYKILIVWMADKMNIATANKLLKIIEEPPAQSLILMITENEEDIIQTIKSRCQTIKFSALSAEQVSGYLVAHHRLTDIEAKKIAFQSQGNLNKAIKIATEISADDNFEAYFIQWVRAAFKAKKNPAVIQEILSWSEQIATLGREKQKLFIDFCVEMFRQALLTNYQAKALVYYLPDDNGFKLENFAPFVNGNNIIDIFEKLNDARYHIERNANAKIIFSDLSIQLTRLIHKK